MTSVGYESKKCQQLTEEWGRWIECHGEYIGALRDAALKPQPAKEYLDAQKAYHQALYDGGWLARGWEITSGVMGDAVTRAAVYDLLGQSGFPLPTTVSVLEVLAPALSRYAPDLAARYLERLIAGHEAWCQGFSEPNAGSDLASLRTRAVQDGDQWVLNGQKTWSTRAYGSDRCVVLARTGAQEARHRALSMFLVDMDTSGVVCRPIDEMAGTQHFGEIFFDDVRVPANRMIGSLNDGWMVAQHSLQWERGMFAWMRQATLYDQLRRLPDEELGGRSAAFASAYQDVSAVRARSFATIEALQAGQSSGPQVSIDKLLLSAAESSVQDLATATVPVAVDDGRGDWGERLHDFIHSRSASIYGGSAEIQQTIVARKVLGMEDDAALRLRHPADEAGYAEIREAVTHLFDDSQHDVPLEQLDSFGFFETLDGAFDVAVTAIFEGQGFVLGRGATVDALLLHAAGSARAGATGILVAVPGDELRYYALSPGEGSYLLVRADSTEATLVTEVALEAVRTADPSWGLYAVAPEVTAVGSSRELGMRLFDLHEIAISLQLIGISNRMLLDARNYSLVREQFGRPIAAFQAVQGLLAKAAVATAAAESLARTALAEWQLDPASDRCRLSALVAAGAGVRGYVTAARSALQVFGAIGYTTEHDYPAYFKRGQVLAYLLGSRTLDLRTANALMAAGVPEPLPVVTWDDAIGNRTTL